MVSRNRNKRKIPSVVPAALGTVVGGGSAAAFATNYLTRQNQYDNHQYGENLYTHMMNKDNNKYTGAGDDGIYTKDEYLNRMRDYYYNGEVFDASKGVTEEYADSMISQAENNPNLFKNGTVDNNSIFLSGKMDQLETNLGGDITGDATKITNEQWQAFKKNINRCKRTNRSYRGRF